ncbi:2-keto-4-pentenoate hydratase/2-oxohepta-3-ene-1,7-dioic acid hydratase (catechol pathway) [Granulicella pectinivorans]|jgi:2-keto-4-pentenoate hydratase/2-oxohepta-3-ene-1,7-dioic acid hydratase in catechol pathway|uniref:2-keto-4-pentenoate hydratase/2-oxohepta-3-ene-1,7-dioic acid hydratase (Catechol pathway) n=1 Tax=Granulicella pectinivorans TaxID=474950 RepID=A0A1I6L5Q5_9BACT|nr:fumarylacetoacetate hydrolase family protein [Granulicella pectinivorans]SFR98600.1 2-keto-4-pentenoate hydratase/2-oxohepta-3-ene-1,7-dioic acid hydratase (catechol pathway) [Granulicella pectinivorans]
MRLGIARANERTFMAAQEGTKTVDLEQTVGTLDITAIIRNWNHWKPILEELVARTEGESSPIVWLAPLPNPPKFLLLAGNFRAHVIESGFAAAPEENLTPQFFIKPSTTIIGATEEIPLTSANHALDYEAELAVVIGTQLRDATLDNAMDAVWGYTVVNDISERKLNDGMVDRKKRSNDDFFDWLVGKWFDGSAPMGPHIVTADEIADEFVVRARLNGELVQEAPASAMIHSVAEAIVYISKVLTLEPGDVISMGTPSGVGMARGRLLRDGDVIECEVGGIGTLRNRVALR